MGWDTHWPLSRSFYNSETFFPDFLSSKGREFSSLCFSGAPCLSRVSVAFLPEPSNSCRSCKDKPCLWPGYVPTSWGHPLQSLLPSFSTSAELFPAEAHCYPPSMVPVSQQHVAELPTAPIHVPDRAPFKGCAFCSLSAPPSHTEEGHKVRFSSSGKKGDSSSFLSCFPALYLNLATEREYGIDKTGRGHDLRGYSGG